MSDNHTHDSMAVASAQGEIHAAHDHHDLHLSRVFWIGGLLGVGTALTVALSYIDFGSRERNIAIAMALATVKVSLVCAYFMHLKGEKPLIWKFLYFTAFFVAGLFLLTSLAWVDPIFGTERNRHGNERTFDGFELQKTH